MQQKPRRSIAPIIRVANADKTFPQLPSHLRPMQYNRYPPDNAITFERFFLNDWHQRDERERIYLPIQWTALYCNNGYGNAPIVNTIQKYLDDLDTSKKYYTIVQYDDGILNNIDHLDIKVCAMAGPRIDFSLPLLCTPHKFNFQIPEKKKYIASFIGSYTHSMRASMVEQLKDKPGYYISTKHHDLRQYCEIISQSKYVLCPRGYGQSSFRIQEAIDFGAVPIYISDEFILPYTSSNAKIDSAPAALPMHLLDLEWLKEGQTIDDFIKAMDVHYTEKVNVINESKHLFTYQGCKNEILNHLSNEQQLNTGGNTTL